MGRAVQHVVSKRASQSWVIHVRLRTRGPLASRYEGTATNGPSGWQGSGLRACLVRGCSRVVETQERASVEIGDCSFRAPLFCQAGLACERALVAIRLRSSMHVSRRRRWMALAVRGVYDDLVYGITRPFVAFQGSNWVGYPGSGIPGSDRDQSAPRASRGEREALVHPLARRALSRS
jgi:hypothetical protein